MKNTEEMPLMEMSKVFQLNACLNKSLHLDPVCFSQVYFNIMDYCVIMEKLIFNFE